MPYTDEKIDTKVTALDDKIDVALDIRERLVILESKMSVLGR